MGGSSRGPWREELASFLRAHRAKLRPADVGLPGGGRRRTPGLRRQEVAELAGVSVDYYIRLEQGRGPRPSRQVLAALARALMLTRDEREYLMLIAGEQPAPVVSPSQEVSPSVRHLLDSMAEVPAYVVDAAYHILAWNRLAAHFLGELTALPLPERNLIRWVFRQPDDAPEWERPEAARFARSTVADLRAAYARYRDDPRIESLVTELLDTSPRFAEMWRAQEVQVHRRMAKRIEHPLAGPLAFECQVLRVEDTDQRMITYVAPEGSKTREAFRRLAAVPPPAPVAPVDSPERTARR